MSISPYLYSQSDILTNIRLLLSEPTAERWTDAQIYACMNMAITGWQGRVRVPYVYTLENGWQSGIYEYTLPDYVDTRTIQPQVKTTYSEWPELVQETWIDILTFSVDPGQVLRLEYSIPKSRLWLTTDEGRVIWWAEPGPVPTTLATLSSSITDSDTSLTISSKPVIGRVGYVKVNSEWLQYSGYTEGASSITLTNLSRGLNGSTAASHTLGDTVTWGVAMDTPALLNALYDATRMYLMDLWLMNTSSRETSQYEKQLVLFQDRVDKFWRGYRPARAPKMRLSRRAIGDI
jgi:hypothetical protein